MTLPDWNRFAERAMTVPFKDMGRDFDGWDCWGLCVVAYRELFQIELPDVDYTSATRLRENAKILTREKAQFQQIKTPVLGCIALITRGGRPIHAGLVSTHGLILHCEERVWTVQESITALRIDGYYRYA